MKWHRPPKKHFEWTSTPMKWQSTPMKWLFRRFFFKSGFLKWCHQFLRPTLSCMLHPHQPSKVGMMLQSCHGDMVLEGHVVGESYKHANRLMDFRIFWDCWNVRNTILRLEIHVHQKSQPPSDSWAWVCLTFHRMHFHNYWSWDLLENPNDWRGCVGCAHLHADHLLGREGGNMGEWGLSWWSCRSIRILEAKNIFATLALSTQVLVEPFRFCFHVEVDVPGQAWNKRWFDVLNFDKCFQIVQVSNFLWTFSFHACSEWTLEINSGFKNESAELWMRLQMR